ncbi:ROK family protein [Mycoplasma capricolum]|uniref:Glucokinase n=1 Tax=Mycoplasma capricolum subsp. capricolum 14232 TaxID=1188238 RepID=A0A084ERR7_MYCCA|nr:ROK family protein [Mycoplasma capricolum]KEZ20659.1 Glucokinase [Mycoplasma capricolum subsp. capricolum 14232]
MKKILGIDLGGTSAKVGIISQNGDLEHSFSITNPKTKIIKNLYFEIQKTLKTLNIDEKNIMLVGITAPGFVDHDKGIVIMAPNIENGWFNYDLKSEAEFLFKKPVYVINDVNAAALGEHKKGSGLVYKSGLFYWLGTGIGGAIISDGKLISGSHGFAGEFGHGGSNQYNLKCNCGLNNCIEKVCSATTIPNSLLKILNNKYPEFYQKHFSNIKNLDMKLLFEIYNNLNKPIELKNSLLEVYNELFNHMSLLIHALDPDVVIIGGGGSLAGNNLLELFEFGVRNKLTNSYKDIVDFKLALLKNDAGMIGAAFYALEQSLKAS